MTRRPETLNVALCGGVVAAVCLAYWWPVLTGENVLFARDLPLFWFSAKAYWVERITQGALPLWAPNVALGMPFTADIANQTFYPLNLVFLIAPDVLVGVGWFVAAHVFGGMVAMWWLGRRLDLPHPIAAWGALLFGFSGVVLSGTSNLTYLPGTLWVPLALVALLGVAPWWIRALRLGACVAMLTLAGDLVDAAVLLVVLATVSIARAARHDQSWSETTLTISLVVLAGLGLAAVQILPTLDVFRGSVRGAGLPAAEIGKWSFPPIRTLEFLHANLFGIRYPINEYFGAALYPKGGYGWFESVYLGVVPIVLGFAAAIAVWKRHAGWVAMALACGLLSWGQHLPGFQAWMESVPFFNTQRYPEKMLFWANLALVTLAMLGARVVLDRAARPVRGSLWLIRFIVASAVVVTVLVTLHWPLKTGLGEIANGLSLWWSEKFKSPTTLGQGLMLHAGMMVLPALVLIVVARMRQWILITVLACVIADLVWMHDGLVRHANRSWLGFDRPPALLAALSPSTNGESRRVLVDGRRLYPPRSSEYPPLIWRNKFLFERLFYNGATRFGVTYMNAEFSPLAPRVRENEVQRAGANHDRETLVASGVRYVVTGMTAPENAQWAQEGMVLIAENASLDARVYEVVNTRPVVTMAPHDAHALTATRMTPEHWAINISPTATAPRELIIRETYDPNWRATADDEPIPLTETERGFIRLSLGPNAVRVDLRYTLPSAILGGLISAGLLVIFCAAEIGWRRHRRYLLKASG
ncbi:MAG: hypothetical protein K0U93_22065 [Gammaproteobacteria bacterium]|nr:hypothetical protein [Gammaproteobacteria bacterium]